MRNTIINKLCAILMVICGVAVARLDNDGTALVFMLCFAIPMFFSKENWFC